MSRSNPTENSPNPATQWFEWSSTSKCFSYWDKTAKERVDVKLPFTFIVLDRTSTVRGYNKRVASGIYSNEVKDLRAQPFVVKYFKAGELASGFWDAIKEKVVANKGKFALNIYIAFKNGGALKIGCFQAVGCAVSAWIDFEKASGAALYAKAVTCGSTRHDKSGDVEFNAPVFSLKDLNPETNTEALALDKQLQDYFKSYFKRTTTERAQPTSDEASPHADTDDGADAAAQAAEAEAAAKAAEATNTPPLEDDVPF